MPNWCYNRINVFGNENEEKLKEVHEIFATERPFNEIFPMPDWKNTPNSKGELAKVGTDEKSRWFNFVGNL